MKNLFRRLTITTPRRLGAALIVAMTFALPAFTLAAQTVQIDGILGVANVTAGDTKYSTSVNAKYDQVVKYQVYYLNKEAADSNKVANNLIVKIDLPSTAGKAQKATATIKADNSNTVTSSAAVNLDRSDAYLQYIPGSAVWRHNVNGKYTDTTVSDAVVTSGLRLENTKPGENYSASVTVLARVMVPGVKVVKEVEKANETDKWADSNTANPADTLRYKITYQNTGNTKQDAVVISDRLPTNMTLLPGTTHVYNPNDVLDKTDHLASGGLDLGNYTPGAGLVVTFEAKLPTADKLACGDTTFTNVGVAQPKGMQQYFDTARTVVTKKCAPATKETPVYGCEAFDFTKGDDRTITVSKFVTSANNGAVFKNVVLDWGDGSNVLTTDKAIGKTHTYHEDGSYTVTATAHFTVDGADKTAAVGPCTKAVSFTATPTSPATPSTEELANTGTGSVIGIFGAAMVAGVLVHRLFLARRLSRQ